MSRLPDSIKYTVRAASGETLTHGATRKDAFAVRDLLGEGFWVFNRFTRKESTNGNS